MKTRACCCTLALFLFTKNIHAQTVFNLPVSAGHAYAASPDLAGTCDTIFSFAHPVMVPSGITYDGNYLWCSSASAPYLYQFDLNGNFIDSVLFPTLELDTGGDMDFDGSHILFCNEQDGILFKINPATGTVDSQFDLPHNGSTFDYNNYGVAFDGTYIWHTEYSVPTSNQSTLYKMEASTGAVLDSFALAGLDLCIKFIHGALYGIEPQASILHKIDTATGNYLSSEPWCMNHSLGLALAESHVWSSSYKIPYGTERIYQFERNVLSGASVSVPELSCQVFPNPATEQLSVLLHQTPAAPVRIEIGNVLDQKMQVLTDQKNTWPDQQFDFDISRFPPGIYMVKIQVANARALKTVVKLE